MQFEPCAPENHEVLAADMKPVLEFIKAHTTQPQLQLAIKGWMLKAINDLGPEDWPLATFLRDVGVRAPIEGNAIPVYMLTMVTSPFMNEKEPTDEQREQDIEQMRLRMLFLQVNNAEIVGVHETAMLQ